MKLRAGAVALVVLSLVGSAACSRPADSRLVVESDTLDFFGDDAVAPEVSLVAADGREKPVRRPALRLSSDSAFRIVDDAFLRCLSPGEATVTLTSGARSARFVARCRPAERFAGIAFVDLVVGDPPREIELFALDSIGRREPIRRFVATVRDSGIVEVRDRFIHAVRVGRTTITFRVVGARFPSSVTVREVIAHDSLRLSPGEFRSWRLAKGRYEITMQSATVPADFKAIEMTTEGARCVRDTRRDETIHCFVRDRGGVAVRNIAASTSGLEQRAVLWLVKAP